MVLVKPCFRPKFSKYLGQDYQIARNNSPSLSIVPGSIGDISVKSDLYFSSLLFPDESLGLPANISITSMMRLKLHQTKESINKCCNRNANLGLARCKRGRE